MKNVECFMIREIIMGKQIFDNAQNNRPKYILKTQDAVLMSQSTLG